MWGRSRWPGLSAAKLGSGGKPFLLNPNACLNDATAINESSLESPFLRESLNFENRHYYSSLWLSIDRFVSDMVISVSISGTNDILDRRMTYQLWRLSEAGPDNLGLACTDHGLLLGATPLIELRNGRFAVRQCHEIERLLRRGYRRDVAAESLMSGLGTVARALNAGDPCLARIAAVHLKIPDLPNAAARAAMEVEDCLIKYANEDWDPAKHPRAGTPPNPGWFATTGGDTDESQPIRTAANDDPSQRSDASPMPPDDWVRLPPGPKRIDELADFVEWMANAKPGDEQAIKAEIKRYFYDVGDQGSAAALNSALTVLLRPDLTREERQRILDSLDVFTRADPAEYAHNRDWTSSAAIAAGTLLPNAAATEGTAAEGASAEPDAAGATADAPSPVWKFGWARRGREIHEQFSDGSLGPNFPTIDIISPTGVVTSFKSIDLNAAVYQNDSSLMYRVSDYVGRVSEFEGAELASDRVISDQITGRILQLIVPRGSMTDAQQIVIEAVRAWAKKLDNPVNLVITEL